VVLQHIWREPTDWIEETRGKGIVACTSFPILLSVPTHTCLHSRRAANSVQPSVHSSRSGKTESANGNLRPQLVFLRPLPCIPPPFVLPPLPPFPTNNPPESYPNVIWIYAFSTPHNPHFKPTLHTLLILNSPAKASVWQPLTESGELLTIVSASKSFTTWREPLGSDLAGTAEGVGIPSRTSAPSFPDCILRRERRDSFRPYDSPIYLIRLCTRPRRP
jgi:hypothetical protein